MRRGNGKANEGSQQKGNMNCDLRYKAVTSRELKRIGIAQQQSDLKEKETNRPSGGAASEPRKNVPCHHRLHLKQQESRQGHRRCCNDETGPSKLHRAQIYLSHHRHWK